MAERHQIQYAPQAVDDIRSLRASRRTEILNAIENHLIHEPKKESRSRIKRLTQPFWSQYRLRIGDFRVYYDVDGSIHRVVVLRVLEKGSGMTPEASP